MKRVSEKPLPNGKRRVVLELDPGERLLSVRAGAHYKLGHPVNDVVAAHVLETSAEVTWCSAGQEWVP